MLSSDESFVDHEVDEVPWTQNAGELNLHGDPETSKIETIDEAAEGICVGSNEDAVVACSPSLPSFDQLPSSIPVSPDSLHDIENEDDTLEDGSVPAETRPDFEKCSQALNMPTQATVGSSAIGHAPTGNLSNCRLDWDLNSLSWTEYCV